MDILYLVDRLENLISSSKKMPLSNSLLVKESEILKIIEVMRTSIPDEIKQARRIIQEKERLLAQAQADASTLLARAREETERVMNREGLLRAAEARSQELLREATGHAQEIVHQAQEHAEQRKLGADAYAAETLRNLREHLLAIETEVSRHVLSIEKGLESLGIPRDAHDQDDRGREDEDYYEEGEEFEEASAQPIARRTSSATDITGGPTYQ
jgi:cell division septum initiation protein DivIVA